MWCRMRCRRELFVAVALLKFAHAFTTFKSHRPSWSLALSEETTDGDLNEAITGITLKIAFDEQGGVADLSSEKSERFTCGESLDMVHRLRRVSDAVLVGRSTVEIDDCTLTVRRVPLVPEGQEPLGGAGSRGKQPYRIIIDPDLDLELNRFKIFQDGIATIVIHKLDTSMTENPDTETKMFVKSTKSDFPDVTFLAFHPIVDGENKPRLCTKIIRDVLADEFGIRHIMVEGGPNTALNFLKDRTVDRAILVYAPISFKDPLLSNLSKSTLENAGLEPVGEYISGVDSIKCYSRPELSWPSIEVTSWP